MKTELILMLVFVIGLFWLNIQIRRLDVSAATPPACPNGRPLEPFIAPVVTLNIPCGVEFPTCPNGSTCGNGWCVATEMNPLRENCPLPVLP